MSNEKLLDKLDWGSHLPLLKAIMDVLENGSIVEFGIGLFSTPYLAQFQFIGYESDSNWMERVKKMHPNANIRLWDSLKMEPFPVLKDTRLLFIDSKPAHTRGFILKKALKDFNIPIIVWHDSDDDLCCYYLIDGIIQKSNRCVYQLNFSVNNTIIVPSTCVCFANKKIGEEVRNKIEKFLNTYVTDIGLDNKCYRITQFDFKEVTLKKQFISGNLKNLLAILKLFDLQRYQLGLKWQNIAVKIKHFLGLPTHKYLQ